MVWLVSLLWVGTLVQWHHFFFPVWLMWFTAINFGLNFMSHWFLAYPALYYRKHTVAMVFSAVLYPFYMVLHSVASYKALWQLIVKPHFWEKTTHGLSRYIDESSLERDVIRRFVSA